LSATHTPSVNLHDKEETLSGSVGDPGDFYPGSRIQQQQRGKK
jgi:hypothetical protein